MAQILWQGSISNALQTRAWPLYTVRVQPVTVVCWSEITTHPRNLPHTTTCRTLKVVNWDNTVVILPGCGFAIYSKSWDCVA